MNRCLSVTARRAALTVLLLGLTMPGIIFAEVTPLSPSAAPLTGPSGQPITPVPIPAATKPTTNPAPTRPPAIAGMLKQSATLTPAQAAVIDSYVKTSFARLLSDDANAIETARADLVAGCSDPAPKQPCSAPYLTQYMGTLVAQLQTIVGKAALSKRVNAAIVIARVAENINNGGNAVPLQPLYPFIISELNDKCDAVALWGMKAAAVALSAAPGVPGQQIMNSIVPCVVAHGLNGALTEEAYDALNSTSPQAIAETMKLYKARVGAYSNGAAPTEPAVDRRAATHLTSATGMWGKLNKAQQTEVMDLIRQNLEGARNALAANGGQPAPELLIQLRTLIIDDCKAVYVATLTDPAMGDLNIESAHVTKLSDTIPAQQLITEVDPVITSLGKAFPVRGAVAKP